MKKFWMILLLSIIGLPAATQNIAYSSLAEFMAQHGDTISALKIEKRAKNQIVLTGGADYRLIASDNESLSKWLKNRCYIVQADTALYVNCKKLRYKKLRFGAWYAPVLLLDNTVYFSAIPLGTVAAGSSAKMDVMLGGTVGDAIAASVQVSKRVFYAIDAATGKVEFVGKCKMQHLLKGYPELMDDYLRENSESAEVTGKYLHLLKRKMGSL